MSLAEFDLNIQNYEFKDIELFFKINPRKMYTASEIEKKEYTIREQLLSSGHIDRRIQSDLIAFLQKAKEWIIRVKCTPPPPPSIVPENFRLDTSNYPRSKEAMEREVELISKPQQPFIYTETSEYFPGKLNPIEKRLIYKNLSVDTFFRTRYPTNKLIDTKSTDYMYVLPEPLNNVISVKLTSMELPHMWYDFTCANYTNQMTIHLYDMVGIIDFVSGYSITTFSHTIRLPNGNYDSGSFPQAINNYFTNIGHGLQLLIVEVDPITATTRIRAQNPITEPNSVYFVYTAGNKYYSPNFKFVIDFSIQEDTSIPIYKTMGWMMGFRKSLYTVSILNTFMDSTVSYNGIVIYEGFLTSESSYGSGNTNYVFLEVDDFHNNFPTNTIISASDTTNSSYLGKNILARITLTSNAYTIAIDNASDNVFKKREYFGPVKLEKMRIRLLNRFGDIIDLNDNDYSFLLEITQIYT